MHTLVMASGNAGKLREFSRVFDQHFAEHQIQLKPQSEWSVPDVDETGLSFVENAILKARHAAQMTGHPALADDSGIEVDALKGEPGIYSARYAARSGYAGTETGDAANNQQLLKQLKGVSEAERTARFRCVLVYMRHANDPMPQIFQGAWEGRILVEPQGHEGFGYDPLFYVESEGCTAAELDKDRKNAISHRGQAIQQFIQHWNRS